MQEHSVLQSCAKLYTVIQCSINYLLEQIILRKLISFFLQSGSPAQHVTAKEGIDAKSMQNFDVDMETESLIQIKNRATYIFSYFGQIDEFGHQYDYTTDSIEVC